MTIKLNPRTEQALLEALAVVNGPTGLVWHNGEITSGASMSPSSGMRPTTLANRALEAICSTIVRDGHVIMPLEVEQRHETDEEMQARIALQQAGK